MSKEGNYQTNYQALDEIVDNYFQQFSESFLKKEQGLIRILSSRAIFLRSSILDLKKKTSQQSIQNLIAKKKLQKENERLKLQKNWRGLTQKLKKLQAEDKKLTNENMQAAFDIQNLCERISQLQVQNENLLQNNQKLRQNKKERFFLTEENHVEYVSPYKYSKNYENGKEKNNQHTNLRPNLLSQLQSVKNAQDIPEELLLDFLSQPEVKQKIYKILF